MPDSTTSRAKQISDTLVGRKAGNADTRKLLADILGEWGGTEKFARDVVSSYKNAENSPLIKAKLLEMVQKLVITNSVHKLDPPTRPEDLEDDEIDEAIAGLVGKAMDHVAAKADRESSDASRGKFVPPEEREEDDS